MKYLLMGDKFDGKSFSVPVDEHDQLLLLRYREAEKQVPDFVSKKLTKNFMLETFLYTYYAGHGCQDEK